MRPKPIPILTEEQGRFLEEEMKKPPTEERRRIFERALEVYYQIERNTCLKCGGKEKKCPKGHLKCDQYFLPTKEEAEQEAEQIMKSFRKDAQKIGEIVGSKIVSCEECKDWKKPKQGVWGRCQQKQVETTRTQYCNTPHKK
jgi:ferredoxin